MTQIRAFGEEKSATQWADDPRSVVNAKTIRNRVFNLGLDPETAITQPLKRPKLYTAFGETKSFAEWANDSRCLVEKKTLKNRLVENKINSGSDIEIYLSKAVTCAPTYEAFGEFKTLLDWSKDDRCIVPHKTLISRVHQNIYSLEDALTIPVQKTTIEIFGEAKSVAQWSLDPRCKVSEKLLRSRLSDGWGEELALTTPVKKAGTFEAFGVEKTISEWIEDPICAVKEKATLDSRFKNKTLSNEEAITTNLKIPSFMEEALSNWVKTLDVEVVKNVRDIIYPLELDFYFPKHNLAVELNGCYWHSEKYKDKNYHYNKYLACAKLGIHLIQIWEDDWLYRSSIVKSMIKTKLSLMSNRTFARKTTLTDQVSGRTADSFLDTYHIQGTTNATVRLGLLDESADLVALMMLTKSQGVADWDLVRYATSNLVIGGFSKLLKAFRASYEGKIKSFADLSYSNGDLYFKTGFKMDKLLPPDYSYIRGRERLREHKFNYRKSRFRSDPDLLYDDTMTEKQLAALNGILRVYDAGKLRFVLD